MERAPKRPRLSMFADMQPDAELDRARHHNDLLLKKRFEAIFDKYARDFSGVGDVVDLYTGRIVEDNGHLRDIDNEKDAGQPRSLPSKLEQKQPASGRSLLRAMTVAPDRDDSYFSDANADDVIQSIETIAENAALSDDGGDTESLDQRDDTLSGTDAVGQGRRHISDDTPFTSDVDSLFEVVHTDREEDHCDNRESSPDSLFGGGLQRDLTHVDPSDGDDESAPLQDFTEAAIYAEFGPRVGKRVVELIEKRDKAELHIDPAWRIPVQAQPRATLSTRSHSTVSWVESPPPELGAISPSPIKGKSMWDEGTKRQGSRFAPRAEALFLAEDESDDPLHDGFDTDQQSDSDEEADLARCDKALRQGVCPYCLEQYVDRAAALQHLNREIKFCQRGEDRGEHVLDHLEKFTDYIHEQAKKKTPASIRGPRLPVCDFKTMVELHEGAGMTFREIVGAGVLWTLKDDPDLLAFLYFGWRDVEDVMGLDGRPSKEWSKMENRIIGRLLKRRRVGMDSLKGRLPKRSAVEIGNKLADMWLTELHTGSRLLTQEEAEERARDEEEMPPSQQTRGKPRRAQARSISFSDDETDPEYRPEPAECHRPKRKAPRAVVEGPEPGLATSNSGDQGSAKPEQGSEELVVAEVDTTSAQSPAQSVAEKTQCLGDAVACDQSTEPGREDTMSG
ncbi:hypothetical protein DV735_g5959, partial [Chaetothyriales sp. CBS 134920]